MTIIVAVGAVVIDDGKVLLVKHKPERGGFWAGKWICPGGGLKLGERIKDGIRREVFEETRLKIELIKPLTPFERIVKENGKVKLHVIYIDYIAKRIEGEFSPCDDVGEGIWVPFERLKGLSDLHEDTIRLLKIAKLM